MASINGISGGMSSIYGNRNVLTGLASGMDTESMIQNAISGYKMKITGLQQKQTKVLWQQQAYRSIIDKMANFTQKYTSYTSGTNLLSSSFFNSAVNYTAKGDNAKHISAIGKTSSDVQILGVKQLASAATYKVNGGDIGIGGAIQGERIDLAGDTTTSNLTGTLTLTNGKDASKQVLDLKLTEEDLKDVDSAQELKELFDKKLADAEVINSKGEKVKANEVFQVEMDGEGLKFTNLKGNALTVEASGKLKDALSIPEDAEGTSMSVGVPKDGEWTKTQDTAELLNGKEVSFTLDGVTKKIKLSYEEGMTGKQFLNNLQTQLNDEFGGDKIQVGGSAAGTAFRLNISATQKGSTLSIAGGEVMGLASDNESTYMNSSKTLGDILGKRFPGGAEFAGPEGDLTKIREIKDKDGNVTHYVDEKGNRLKKVGDGEDAKYYRVDDKDKALYEFKINGTVVGAFNEDTAFESVMTAINNNADAGVSVNYSKTTNQFRFETKEMGADSKIEFEGLSAALFQPKEDVGTSTDGKDAVFTMTVNGEVLDGITRSSNSFDVDGLKVNLKGTFGDYAGGDSEDTLNALDDYRKAQGGQAQDEALRTALNDLGAEVVTFESATDSDKIVNAIKDMAKDYNEMVGEIRKAFSTLPTTQANGKRYEPLTDEDLADMSESAIKAYEEKAKQGLLFADRDLSNLYNQLTNAISPGGKDGALLRSIGIDTDFSQGLSTLNIDEGKLRAALENDPDQVKDLFTKTMSNGASTNGLIQNVKRALDEYGGVTGARKGILVEKAGSVKAAATLHSNTLQKQIDDYDKQIDVWTTKMTKQVDRYTVQFSQLEQLIAQMNSQSSTFAGLMGGMGG